MLRFLKTALITIITIAFLLFAIANREFIHLSLFPLPYAADMPEFLFAILCFALGVIIGGFMVSLKLSRAKRLIALERKRIAALESELSGLQQEKTEQRLTVTSR